MEAGRSWWGGSSEFDWWWDRAVEVVMGGDGYKPGEPIPMPRGIPVPDVISEEPQTWDELEELHPELFEPILETRPGHVADSYPQDVAESEHEDDEVAHTWSHWGRELVSDWLNPAPTVYNPPDPFSNTPGPSTPANQTATAAAMSGCDGQVWNGGVPPKGYKVVNYCGQGVLRKIRRRRRRRMLTASDASDLATIVGIVGKGQMASSMINRTRG